MPAPIDLSGENELLVCPVCQRHVLFVERDPAPDSLYCCCCGVHLIRARDYPVGLGRLQRAVAEAS